ncbi:MAG: hypothetical protein ACQXXL_08555 [Candidatus Methanosuratincola sp.]|jgi:hypothetical protein|nr:hypothetical protein [Candidatus Methanosuratincola sp.]
MEKKIKTSIMINRDLWEELRSRVGGRGRLKDLSRAVEEAIEDETGEALIIEALSSMLGDKEEIQLTISPVKPKVPTDAGKIIRGMREGSV